MADNATSDPDPDPAIADPRPSRALAANWGWVLLRGLLAIVTGIIAITTPLAALGGLILVFAVYAAADGIAAIVSAVRAARGHRQWVWFLVEGLINLAAAAFALFLPIAAAISFVAVAAFWALFSGVAMLVAAIRLDMDHGRLWLVLGGIVSVVLGVLLLFNPAVGAVVLTQWFGVYALAFGIALTILAFRLRSRARA